MSLSNYARVIVGSFHFFFWLKEVYFFMVSAVHIYLSLPELEPGSLASLELLCAAAKSEEEGGGVGGRGRKKNCTQRLSAHNIHLAAYPDPINCATSPPLPYPHSPPGPPCKSSDKDRSICPSRFASYFLSIISFLSFLSFSLVIFALLPFH